MLSDTIHALASGALPAGIGVVRVSGPLVPALIADWIARPLSPRTATLAPLRDAAGEMIDEALAIHFPAPRSFTGEDVLELHCHGGPAVVRAVMERLNALGSRAAEPGEFTMRAHRNGRIDLMEAERLAGLIEAQTEVQRRFASSERGARLTAMYEGWRADLLHGRALIEASLDFADEEDAPSDVSEEIMAIIHRLRDAIRAHLATDRHREIVREGLRVAVLGPPNAGKSSLVNALSEREVAIVTDVPGTTRDAIEVALELHGHKVVLVDTAGLRDTDDVVERIGVERARARAAESDCVLWLQPVDASHGDAGSGADPPNDDPKRPVVMVATKADLRDDTRDLPAGFDLAISTRTGEGMNELTRRIAAVAEAAAPPPGEETTLDARHARHLAAARDHLNATGSTPDERVAEAVRLAAVEIGRITGATDIEDVYGAIFSRFCMGK